MECSKCGQSTDKGMTLPCTHAICFNCQKWEGANTCPVCNESYDSPVLSTAIPRNFLWECYKDLVRTYFTYHPDDEQYAGVANLFAEKGDEIFEEFQMRYIGVDKYVDMVTKYLAICPDIPAVIFGQLRQDMLRVPQIVKRINDYVEWLLAEENTLSSPKEKIRIQYTGDILRGYPKYSDQVKEAARELDGLLHNVGAQIYRKRKEDWTDWMRMESEKSLGITHYLHCIAE